MSKSDPDTLSCIYISDSPDVIEKKVKSSVTDTIKEVYYDPDNRLGVSNLITIYSELSGETPEALSVYLQNNNVNKVRGKQLLTELLIEKLQPIQSELSRLLSDKQYIDSVVNEGRDRASDIAANTMTEVRSLVGLR